MNAPIRSPRVFDKVLGVLREEEEEQLEQLVLARGYAAPSQIEGLRAERQRLREEDPESRSDLSRLLVERGILTEEQREELHRTLQRHDLGLFLASQAKDVPSVVRESLSRPECLLGRYVLVREVGRGGMGAVHQAWDRSLNRWVALKILSDSAGESIRTRFVHEARAIAALAHPNIITIHDAGAIDGRHFLSMRYVDGPALSDITLSPAEALQSMRIVARAVAAAHDRGILHRDIKPQNILRDRDGIIFIADFGLARSESEHEMMTKTGQVLGTPNYMSPEQASGRHSSCDVRTDVYGLGATMYHLLTGSPPFPRGAMPAVLHAVQFDDPLPPRRLRPDLGRDVEAVCLKAMERDPRRRYASADEMADDLDRLLQGRAVSARRVTILSRSRKWIARNPLLSGALATALFALSGGAALGLLHLVKSRDAARALAESGMREKRAVEDRLESERWFAKLMRLSASVKDAQTEQYLPIENPSQYRDHLLRLMDETRTALSHLPSSAHGSYVLGIALRLLGRDEEASAEFSRAIELAGAKSESAFHEIGEAHLERARTALRRIERHRYPYTGLPEAERIPLLNRLIEGAIADLQALHDVSSRETRRHALVLREFLEFDTRCQSLLADPSLPADEAVRQGDRIATLCRESIDRGGRVEAYHDLLGQIHRYRGDLIHRTRTDPGIPPEDNPALREYRQSRTCFQQALRIHPNHTEALVHLGTVNGKIATEFKRHAHVLRGLKQDPRTSLEEHRRHLQEAVNSLTRCIEIQPDDIDAYYCRAHFFFEDPDRFHGVVEDCTAVLIRVQEHLGAVHRRGHGFASLSNLFRIAAQCAAGHPAAPSVHFETARLFYRACRRDVERAAEVGNPNWQDCCRKLLEELETAFGGR